jgi:Exopolyphosphatase
MGKSTKLVSAIDVGSNTIRMIIAEIGENTGINIIDEVKKPIDIGKDTYNYGKISIETIKEACKILKILKANA